MNSDLLFTECVMLKITNTVTGKKEIFNSLKPEIILMYVCGISPYDRAHVGHGRCYVTFDILYRLLRLLGYNVTYVRNFTDIDDKLLERAQAQWSDRHRYKELANQFIATFHNDMRLLNCIAPSYEPRVTDNIPAIINFIEQLIAAGHAYAVDGDVYFDLRTFPGYGKLSKHKLEDLRAGARVEVNDKKRDPLDFALWKSEPVGEFWQSPWGWGRPGWHIECSALAKKYLADRIDVHGGGLDLVFPHHENEIAQSESLLHEPFAQYWVHNGFVTIDKEKMSKSLGNFFTLDEIFKIIDPMVLRYFFLNHHYRAPLEFSRDVLLATKKSYERLVAVLGNIPDYHFTYAQLQEMPISRQMLTFLVDDLNTPGMLGIVFEHLQELHHDEKQRAAVAQILKEVCGLLLLPLPQEEVEMTSEIMRLLQEREKARDNKDWTRADALRDQLQKLGVAVHDKKTV
jgi:cysteinyl-tRNA synthetase